MNAIAAALTRGGLDLQPFQRRFLRGAFAPGVTVGALCAARGSGKTELIGRIGAQVVIPGSPLFRPEHEAVVFAGSMRQAKAVYKAARRAVPAGVKVRKRDSNQETCLIGPDGTKLNVFPSSGKRALGLGANEHLLICDEPASWNVRDGDLLWSAVTQSLGKLEDQRVLVIGTLSPAEADSWWPRLVAAGSDASTYVQVHRAGKDDPWDSLQAAERANPLLRANRTLRAVVKGERAKARRDPELQASYEAFRLNRHRSAERNDLVTPDEWEAVLRREAPAREGAAVLGVDLGASRSWSACALAWPSGRLEVYASIPGLPSIRDQERRDGLARGTLDRLVDQGVVAVAEGLHVAAPGRVLDLLLDVEIAGVVADRFASGALADELAARGLPEPEWRVNQWSTASEDIAAFRASVLDGPLAVPEGGHRLLSTISLAATRIERDSSGNAKLLKTHRRRRDDVSQAAVLAVSALARWPKPVPLRVLTLA